MEFAEKIAERHAERRQRPAARRLVRRDGARSCAEGEEYHRFAWHDRKAWWQQEQGILAYLILDGIARTTPSTRKLARESAAFYNALFLDHDSGGVYFNVLANGMPYLLGTERLKGSHSMSGYHSTELCYLAAVYSNLLVTKQPLDLLLQAEAGRVRGQHPARLAGHPAAGQHQDRARSGSTAQRWTDFDAEKLTVNLPKSDMDLRVKVRVAPAALADTFTATTEIDGDTADADAVRRPGPGGAGRAPARAGEGRRGPAEEADGGRDRPEVDLRRGDAGVRLREAEARHRRRRDRRRGDRRGPAGDRRRRAERRVTFADAVSVS